MRVSLLTLLALSLIGCAAGPQLPEGCYKPTAAEMRTMGWAEEEILKIELMRAEKCVAPARADAAERRRIFLDGLNETSRRLHELNLQRNAPRPVYQAPTYRPPLNCTSTRVGTQVYTNCY